MTTAIIGAGVMGEALLSGLLRAGVANSDLLIADRRIERSAEVTEKFGVPMVEAEGASRSLFTQGYKYMFAVLSTSEYYLAPVLDLIAQRSKDDGKSPSDLRIGMAFENDGFSLDVRAGVLDAIREGLAKDAQGWAKQFA